MCAAEAIVAERGTVQRQILGHLTTRITHGHHIDRPDETATSTQTKSMPAC